MHFTHTLWQRNTTTISTTIDTTTGTLSSQTIAITVLAVLFTLSELLASIPEIGANGIVQGFLYYVKKGTGRDTSMNQDDIAKKISELREEITKLITNPSSVSVQAPEQNVQIPEQNVQIPEQNVPSTTLTYDVNQISDQVAAISNLVSAKKDVDGNLNESDLVQIASQVNEISRLMSHQTVSPPKKYEGPGSDNSNSMPPGILPGHYVPDN